MEIDHKRMYWNSAASANNKLAVAHNGWLSLYDMATGQELWKQAIKSDMASIENFSKVFISLHGNIIALQERIGEFKTSSLKTYIYDGYGNLLWDEENKMEIGVTNGGLIKVISENERYLLRADLQRI